MRKFINIIAVLLLAVVSSSCLKHDLEDLEVYTESNIIGVQGVYWRYYGSDKNPGSNEQSVKQIRVDVSDVDINAGSATCNFSCSLGSSFPADQAAKFDTKKVVVVLNISTAAVIEPLEGSPKLGVPGDWSKPNKYKVTAANGTSKTWTVSMSTVK